MKGVAGTQKPELISPHFCPPLEKKKELSYSISASLMNCLDSVSPSAPHSTEYAVRTDFTLTQNTCISRGKENLEFT